MLFSSPFYCWLINFTVLNSHSSDVISIVISYATYFLSFIFQKTCFRSGLTILLQLLYFLIEVHESCAERKLHGEAWQRRATTGIFFLKHRHTWKHSFFCVKLFNIQKQTVDFWRKKMYVDEVDVNMFWRHTSTFTHTDKQQWTPNFSNMVIWTNRKKKNYEAIHLKFYNQKRRFHMAYVYVCVVCAQLVIAIVYILCSYIYDSFAFIYFILLFSILLYAFVLLLL